MGRIRIMMMTPEQDNGNARPHNHQHNQEHTHRGVCGDNDMDVGTFGWLLPTLRAHRLRKRARLWRQDTPEG